MLKNSTVIKASPPGISSCLLYITAYWVALLILGRLFVRPELAPIVSSWPGQGAAVVVAAVLGLAFWSFRSALYRTLTSLPFAVSMMIAIIISTALGTFILQGTPTELNKAYGPALTKLFVGFGINDLFHTLWFQGFLLLLAVSLVLVAVKKRMWRVKKWGHLMAHLGVVVVLLGGLAGSIWGFKGFMDLKEGKPSSAVRSMKGGKSGLELPGFAIELKKFEIEHYSPEYRIYLYQNNGGNFSAVKWYGLKDAADWHSAGGLDFRLTKTYTDFAMHSELEPAAEEAGGPALGLDFAHGSTVESVNLFSGDPESSQIDLAPAAPPVEFVWNAPDEAQIAASAKAQPESHVVAITDPATGKSENVEVAPGGSYRVLDGKYTLRVLNYMPDFVYDMGTHQPSTRSLQPNNPALQVALTQSGSTAELTSWLFSKMPDFSMSHGESQSGPKMVFKLTPASTPIPHRIIIAGKTRELLEVQDGKVVKRETLGPESGGIPELHASAYRILASAREKDVYENKSEEWNNPVAELELRQGGKVQTVLLPSSHQEPLKLPDGKTVLTFEEKPDDVKAYRSMLAVIKDGNETEQKTIAVNNPLVYRGWHFYQSSFRKEDPTYSGIEVVKDPGMPLIWTGFVMVCFGVVFTYYIRPRIKTRRENNAG